MQEKESILKPSAVSHCARPAAILLVDDEKAFADALAFRLETHGHPCLVAYRGEQALAMLERQELETVILDLNMPGLHGLEALRLMKSRRPDVEVILLTGEADFSVAAKGMRRGAGDYLLKPVEFQTLLESIEKAGQRSRDHRERLRAAEAGRLISLGALAAGVGHEINNPLQIILQRSEWLQELITDAGKGQTDLPEMAKSARVIQKQAEKAGGITAALLALARKTREGKAQSDVAELIAKTFRQQQERADALGVTLLSDIHPGLPKIACSPAELEPVFMHLVRNALDAIESQLAQNRSGLTDLSDTALREEELSGTGRVLIRALATETGIRITVADNGEGVVPEHQRTIFDPFFSLRPVGKGTGLGLTVCHSIVTALRGTIRFEPATPRGAVFTLGIPVLGEEAEPQTEM